MQAFFDSFRELTIVSVLLRLFLALLFGGVIGLNGTRKQRAAGFRTYMLVCMGAALTMILSQYCFLMMQGMWSVDADTVRKTTDVSRYGAKVMNGIGFLAAGTVITTGRQEVKGVTTAAGLWASACMGLAVGAGFFECVIVGFALIALSLWVLPHWETLMIDRASNLNIYVEFQTINTLSELISMIKALDIRIYDIDIDHGTPDDFVRPNAIIMLHMNKKMLHTKLISELSDIEGVYSIKEL